MLTEGNSGIERAIVRTHPQDAEIFIQLSCHPEATGALERPVDTLGSQEQLG